jgi:hypothetical protein
VPAHVKSELDVTMKKGEPLLDISSCIRLLWVLPGEKAQQTRDKLERILVRHFAGDVSLSLETSYNAVANGPVNAMARDALCKRKITDDQDKCDRDLKKCKL